MNKALDYICKSDRRITDGLQPSAVQRVWAWAISASSEFPSGEKNGNWRNVCKASFSTSTEALLVSVEGLDGRVRGERKRKTRAVLHAARPYKLVQYSRASV